MRVAGAIAGKVGEFDAVDGVDVQGRGAGGGKRRFCCPRSCGIRVGREGGRGGGQGGFGLK